jgi:hypothetical protein
MRDDNGEQKKKQKKRKRAVKGKRRGAEISLKMLDRH